ncbi:MAG: pyrroloquinoline quinone biosynthesis peptide chaperone PqqD [Alteromonadaceae bacterium]|nr:pyrroloquinoline quinone biosynthesis peptide chaperone PqqD [Alteromonadaceae bacterium]
MSALSLNPLYRLQFEKAQDCYVLLFPEGMIKLNPSAAEILLQIDGNKDEADIVTALRAKFPDAPEDMDEDVADFVAKATENNWITHG